MQIIILIIFCLFSSTQVQADEHQTRTVITLSPHLTELVYTAGGASSLIGVSAYSNYPPEVSKLTVVGDAFRLDYEIIKTLNPDVIFYWENGTAKQVIEQLKQLKIKLVPIEINQLKDIPVAIEQIAKIINTKPIKNTQQFNQRITQMSEKQPTDMKALIQISDQPIYTVNGSHWMTEIIEICGLQNIYNDLDSYSAAVTLESVVLKKPQVIITTSSNPSNSPLSSWDSIPAINHNRIIKVNPDHFSRPTWRTLLAIETICNRVSQFNPID